MFLLLSECLLKHCSAVQSSGNGTAPYNTVCIQYIVHILGRFLIAQAILSHLASEVGRFAPRATMIVSRRLNAKISGWAVERNGAGEMCSACSAALCIRNNSQCGNSGGSDLLSRVQRVWRRFLDNRRRLSHPVSTERFSFRRGDGEIEPRSHHSAVPILLLASKLIQGARPHRQHRQIHRDSSDRENLLAWFSSFWSDPTTASIYNMVSRLFFPLFAPFSVNPWALGWRILDKRTTEVLVVLEKQWKAITTIWKLKKKKTKYEWRSSQTGISRLMSSRMKAETDWHKISHL